MATGFLLFDLIVDGGLNWPFSCWRNDFSKQRWVRRRHSGNSPEVIPWNHPRNSQNKGVPFSGTWRFLFSKSTVRESDKHSPESWEAFTVEVIALVSLRKHQSGRRQLSMGNVVDRFFSIFDFYSICAWNVFLCCVKKSIWAFFRTFYFRKVSIKVLVRTFFELFFQF